MQLSSPIKYLLIVFSRECDIGCPGDFVPTNSRKFCKFEKVLIKLTYPVDSRCFRRFLEIQSFFVHLIMNNVTRGRTHEAKNQRQRQHVTTETEYASTYE